MTVFGNPLIVASIALRAYLFFAELQAISTLTMTPRPCPPATTLPPKIQALAKRHLCLFVVGLLGSSILMLVSRLWLLKLPTFLNLGLLLWVNINKSSAPSHLGTPRENWPLASPQSVGVLLSTSSEKFGIRALAKTEGSNDKVENKVESKLGRARKRE